MHTHPTNSPAAATRLLALVMMADGHVCPTEMRAVERLALSRLGVPPDTVRAAMRELCEDFFLHGDCGSMSSFGDDTLEALMREVDDRVLQAVVLEAANVSFQTDGHLSEGEERLLRMFARCWPAQREACADQLANRVGQVGADAMYMN